MAESRGGKHGTPAHDFEPLRWIGAYKLLKALLALIGGLMVLRLTHRDLPSIALRWMARLHIEPDSRLGVFILHHILRLSARRIEWAAAGLFGYVPLAVAEGVGLIARKYWAEWLTVITTGALVPVEVHEVLRRPTLIRVVILALNIAVVAYLIVRIRRDRATEADRRGAIICKHAAVERRPILYARRDEPVDPADSGWQFQCGLGVEEDPASFKLLSIEEIVRLEPTLKDHLDAPCGTVMYRRASGQAWSVSSRAE